MGKDRFLNMAFPPGSPVVPKQCFLVWWVTVSTAAWLGQVSSLPQSWLLPVLVSLPQTFAHTWPGVSGLFIKVL